MASATITVPNTGWTLPSATAVLWEGAVSLGMLLSADGATEIFLARLGFTAGNFNFSLSLSDGVEPPSQSGPEFSTVMEDNGTIDFTASNGSTLTLTGIADSTEPYSWMPSNHAEQQAFATVLRGLSDRSLTVVFNDNASVAPSFADDTGDAQTWMQNTAIAAITVPEADGTPTPTYAVEGNLPAGIAFDTTTRVISGTPTATGFGTITIRATNSEGDADWTVDYTISAPASAPSRPAAPTLTVNSDTEITAVGVAPNDGGDTISSYDWRHRITSPLGAWVNRSNVSNLTQVFTGLEAARTYRFQFRATNSVGDSAYSPSANATTDATPTTTTTYEVRVKATAPGFTDSEYSDPPETIVV